MNIDGVWDSVAAVAMQWLLRQPAPSAAANRSVGRVALLQPPIVVATCPAAVVVLQQLTDMMFTSLTRPWPQIPAIVELLVHHEG